MPNKLSMITSRVNKIDNTGNILAGGKVKTELLLASYNNKN